MMNANQKSLSLFSRQASGINMAGKEPLSNHVPLEIEITERPV